MNRVEELQRIRREKERLHDEEKRLSVPIVMNMSMIGNLFDVYRLTLKNQDHKAAPLDTSTRKKFLYAILYLYSPSTLAGNVMRHKLRENISAIVGCTPTGVSRDYKTALFFYSQYKDFRDSVDAIIRNMLYVIDKTDEYV